MQLQNKKNHGLQTKEIKQPQNIKKTYFVAHIFLVFRFL